MAKNAVINTIYVVLFALLMIPLMHHEPFLAAFGFYHENYFILLFIYVHLYYYTVDIPLRILLNLISRKFEIEADTYSVNVGYGKAQIRALVRNFAQNMDIVFASSL